MKPISVLVVDGQSSFALAAIRCLGAAPNVDVHVLSRRRHVPAAVSRHVTSVQICECTDDEDYLTHIVSTARRVGATVCLGVDESAIGLLAQHSARLSTQLPHAPVPPVESLEIANDKWKLARFLHAHKMPHPHTVMWTPERETTVESRTIGGPVLLKPRRGGNGIGIRRFEDGDTLATYLSGQPALRQENIVQNFIAGSDIDCSVLCDRGRVVAHTIQRSFAPSGPFKPAGGIDFVEDARVLAVVSDLMAALEWHGVAHVDLRYDEHRQQLYVIEINPRFWGSLLGSLHAGVNFPYLACLVGLNAAIAAPTPTTCRFVTGSTAVHAWRHGHFGRRSAGFRLSETVFREIRKDPRPFLLELLTSCLLAWEAFS